MHLPACSKYIVANMCIFLLNCPIGVVEKAADKMLSNVQKCASSAKLDYSKLSACYNNKAQALALQKQAAADTPSNHQ